MGNVISLRIPDLLIDAENPRLPQPNVGQREAQRALAQNQQRKLLALARDILEFGLNPSELPIVLATGDDSKRFIVLEGNRRLTALKALENPEPLVGAVDPAVLAEFRKLSKEYQESPTELISCFQVKDKKEADHWIELRHTGQNDGASVVPWSADDIERFRARNGEYEYHSQALNFLEKRGALTPADRRNLPTTSFKRLLGTPQVRVKCGLQKQAGMLSLLGKEEHVIKALMYIVGRLATGKTRTEDIYTQPKRIAFANAMPAEVVVTPIHKDGQGTSPDSTSATSKPKKAAKARRSKPRTVLIPHDCALVVTDPRVRDIEVELRSINLEDFPNANGVLFRVFVELSVDAYLTAHSVSIPSPGKLRHKLEATVNHLIARKKLTESQARPVRRALQKDSFLAPSVDLMHDYVHNKHVFPAPRDLRADWDSLQPFITALWSP